MAALHHGADGDDGVVSDQPDPSEEVPFPRFLAGGDTSRSSPAEDASSALNLQHTLIKQCYLISNNYALKLRLN